MILNNITHSIVKIDNIELKQAIEEYIINKLNNQYPKLFTELTDLKVQVISRRTEADLLEKIPFQSDKYMTMNSGFSTNVIEYILDASDPELCLQVSYKIISKELSL